MARDRSPSGRRRAWAQIAPRWGDDAFNAPLCANRPAVKVKLTFAVRTVTRDTRSRFDAVRAVRVPGNPGKREWPQVLRPMLIRLKREGRFLVGNRGSR